MGKGAVIEALNKNRADELMAITQYMSHYFEAQGLASPALVELFRKIAIKEMIHAEDLAERIVYLGGIPVYQPSPYKRGGDLLRMVRDDLEAELVAIARYKEAIKLCAKEGDSISRILLEHILADEEGHARQWRQMLAQAT